MVVDRSTNQQASTGNFEMVHEIPILKCPSSSPFSVDGIRAITYVSKASASNNPSRENSVLSAPNPTSNSAASTASLPVSAKAVNFSPAKLQSPPISVRSPKRASKQYVVPLKSLKSTLPTAMPQITETSKNSENTTTKQKLAKSADPSIPDPIPITSTRTRPPTPPAPSTTPILPRLKPVSQSRQVLEDLAARLRQKQEAYQKTRIRLISPQSASSDIKGLGDEVNRLMELNETIERLLRFRGSAMKMRAGVVNDFLGARQKKRETVW